MKICTISHSRNRWLQQIEENQKGLIPFNVVEKSKSWFEYLYNAEHPERSTYRCRICYNNYDKFGFANKYKSPLANEEGTLKSDKAENRKAIQEHPKKHSHLKVIEMLEQQSRKR